MKGSPRFEICLFVIAGLLLILPLRLLTGVAVSAPPDHLTVSVSETREVNAWVDFRFSALPEKVKIYQGDVLLWQGGGSRREDGDLTLRLTDNGALLRLELLWPAELKDAYVECSLEVDEMSDLRKGFWSQGHDDQLWNLAWEESQ